MRDDWNGKQVYRLIDRCLEEDADTGRYGAGSSCRLSTCDYDCCRSCSCLLFADLSYKRMINEGRVLLESMREKLSIRIIVETYYKRRLMRK